MPQGNGTQGSVSIRGLHVGPRMHYSMSCCLWYEAAAQVSLALDNRLQDLVWFNLFSYSSIVGIQTGLRSLQDSRPLSMTLRSFLLRYATICQRRGLVYCVHLRE